MLTVSETGGFALYIPKYTAPGVDAIHGGGVFLLSPPPTLRDHDLLERMSQTSATPNADVLHLTQNPCFHPLRVISASWGRKILRPIRRLTPVFKFGLHGPTHRANRNDFVVVCYRSHWPAVRVGRLNGWLVEGWLILVPHIQADKQIREMDLIGNAISGAGERRQKLLPPWPLWPRHVARIRRCETAAAAGSLDYYHHVTSHKRHAAALVSIALFARNLSFRENIRVYSWSVPGARARILSSRMSSPVRGNDSRGHVCHNYPLCRSSIH